MRRSYFIILATLALLFVFLAESSRADPITQINYQGQMKVGADFFTGTGDFKFVITNSSGNDSYWSNDGTSGVDLEPDTAVPLGVNDGLYSVILGDPSFANMTIINPSIFSNGNDLYLRVWFNDGTTGTDLLSPDEKIVSAAYAINAGMVAGSGSSDNYLAVTGNIGIGTTSPDTKLEVVESGDNTISYPARIYNDDQPGSGETGQEVALRFTLKGVIGGTPQAVNAAYIIAGKEADFVSPDWADAKGNLRFYVADTGYPDEKMRIDNDGNVGIGDTSPDASLEVVNSFFVSQTDGADGNWFCVTDGNVGIGTTSPGAILHIDKNSDSADGEIRLQTGARDNLISFYSQFTGPIDVEAGRIKVFRKDSTSGGFMILSVADNSNVLQDRVTIQEDGNVGIGTTNPLGYKLRVAGTVSADAYHEFSPAFPKELKGKEFEILETIIESTENPGKADHDKLHHYLKGPQNSRDLSRTVQVLVECIKSLRDEIDQLKGSQLNVGQ